MNKQLKKDLKGVFIPPEPEKKAEFLSHLPYPKTNNYDFFLSQIGYIRKRFWILSVVMVVAIIFLIQLFDSMSKVIGILSAFLPFLVVLGVLEISKSTSYNMTEMEMSCRHTLGKITLVRLSLVGSFHFVILLCLVILFAKGSEYSFFEFSLYSITPYLLCSYLALFIVNHFRSKDTAYICGGVAGGVSIGVSFLTKYFDILYTQKFMILWGIAFIIIGILLIKEVKKLMKKTEELQWNSPLMA